MPRSTRRRSARTIHAGSGRVRLIAGRWRGRHLPVISAPGLRPSGDRLRETVFNWLQFDLPGARCLDLFAGSGALGLEAASRGASQVDLVEAHPSAARNLSEQVQILGAEDFVRVHTCEAMAYLQSDKQNYDLVFIDPPFDMGCQELLLMRLLDSVHLAPAARVYVEAPATFVMSEPINGYELHRIATFGEVVARVYIAAQ